MGMRRKDDKFDYGLAYEYLDGSVVEFKFKTTEVIINKWISPELKRRTKTTPSTFAEKSEIEWETILGNNELLDMNCCQHIIDILNELEIDYMAERKDAIPHTVEMVGRIKFKGETFAEEYEIGEGKFSIETIREIALGNNSDNEVESAEIIKLTTYSEVIEKIK